MVSEITPKRKARVLSGMRPTGKLHLGHFVGALQNWVRLQETHDCYFFVADWHALTTDYADTSRVKQSILDLAIDWLASGLSAEKCTMFVQSHVPQHAELHLLLSMITPLGWLERVPTYKEQRDNIKDKDLSTYGFLGYPLLQSADILMYRADFVPVGEDQVPHIELTREVARRFNQLYGKTSILPPVGEPSLFGQSPAMFQVTEPVLVEPAPLLTQAAKLPGTDSRKMSKSYNNYISLSEPPLQVKEKILAMVNDPQRVHLSDPGNPDNCPVGDYHKLFSTPEMIETVNIGCRGAKIGCIECKSWAADSVIRFLGPIQTRRSMYEAQPQLALDVLHEGSRKAQTVAEETMAVVRDRMKISGDFKDTFSRYPDVRALPIKPRLILDAKYWNSGSQERGDYIRSEWMKFVSHDISLVQFERRFFRTPSGKRVSIPTAREKIPNEWTLLPRDKNVEVLVALCWESGSYLLHDFVLPQRILQPNWKKLELNSEKQRRVVNIHRHSGHFYLRVPNEEPIDITQYRSEYKPLQ